MPRAQTAAVPQKFDELLDQLGGISPERIWLDPPPGQATKKDLLRVLDHTNHICELIDGTLVEKVLGAPEAALACDLIKILGVFLDRHPLGFLLGEAGTIQILPRLVRIPDVSFISWDKVPNRKRPTKAVPELAPDLAVEVLSKKNTRGEMKRKLKEYFLAGVQVVWLVNPRQRTVEVYTAPDQVVTLTEQDVLSGGEVLPGLTLPVKDLFAQVPRQPERPNGSKPGKRPKKK